MQPKPLLVTSLDTWLERLAEPKTNQVKLGLERIKGIAQDLKLTQFSCPVIIVAGTNGKGSTVQSLSFLAHLACCNIGTFTSPHLFRYNERISINQKAVSDFQLVQAFDFIDKHPDSEDLTYFEWSVLAALSIFKTQSLDLIVLEVGLGGRLDATNILNTDLSIVSSIDIDHEELLGMTRESIGF